ARPVGQLRGVLLRYRLYSEGRALAVRRSQAGGFLLSLGSRRAARIHHQLRRRRELSSGFSPHIHLTLGANHSTAIFTLSPGLSRSCGPSPLSTRKRSIEWSDAAMRRASFSTVSVSPVATTLSRSGLTCSLSFKVMRRKVMIDSRKARSTCGVLALAAKMKRETSLPKRTANRRNDQFPPPAVAVAAGKPLRENSSTLDASTFSIHPDFR